MVKGVMHPKEFGQLVAALRKEQFDPVIGKAWSQKKLAQSTDLSKRIIANIEQGQKINLEVEILVRLANAFRLTTLERREFFAAATRISDPEVALPTKAPVDVLNEILAVLRCLQQPAYIHDAFYDIIAANSLAIDLHNPAGHAGASARPPTDNVNFLQQVFAPDSPLRLAMQANSQQLARRSLQQFRYMSLRYRHTTYFKALFTKLCTYPEFVQLWRAGQEKPEDFYTQLKTYTYVHPQWGPLSYSVTITAAFTSSGNLHLAVLAPQTPATNTLFQQLLERISVTTLSLAHWPKTWQETLAAPPTCDEVPA